MRSLFLACHHDDETLFGAFTLLRHKPDVVVCLLSEVQEAYGITQETRAAETTAALAILGISDWRQWAYSDRHPDWREIGRRIKMCTDFCDHVFTPAVERGGHEHHNRIGQIALDVFGSERVTSYLSYTNGAVKSTHGREVPFEPEWIGLKLRALACYESQFRTPSHRHFVDSLREYVL